MSLDHSTASLMSRLAEWSGFPKYALERRLDIFLTPFLERFVGDRLGGTATLVAPEFPLLAKLKGRTFRRAGKGPGLRTVNVDYLLHLSRPPPGQAAWVFLELKTDPGSFRDAQDHAYAVARRLGMQRLLAHVAEVGEASRKHATKYDLLLERVRSFGPGTDRIELAYLAPPPRDGFPEAGRPANPTRYFDLYEFGEQPFDLTVPEHTALWLHVRELLRALRDRHGSRPVGRRRARANGA